MVRDSATRRSLSDDALGHEISRDLRFIVSCGVGKVSFVVVQVAFVPVIEEN